MTRPSSGGWAAVPARVMVFATGVLACAGLAGGSEMLRLDAAERLGAVDAWTIGGGSRWVTTTPGSVTVWADATPVATLSTPGLGRSHPRELGATLAVGGWRIDGDTPSRLPGFASGLAATPGVPPRSAVDWSVSASDTLADGRTLVAARWSAPRGRQVRSESPEHPYRVVLLASDGRIEAVLAEPPTEATDVAAGNALAWAADGLWAAPVGGAATRLDSTAGGRALAWSGDGRWLAAAERGGRVTVWDFGSGTPTSPSYTFTAPGRLDALAAHPDQPLFLAGGDGLFAVCTDGRSVSLPYPDPVHALGFVAGGLVVGSGQPRHLDRHRVTVECG